MGGSRWGRLAVRAAASGCLDFTEANSASRIWLLREEKMLDELENQAMAELYRMRAQQTATLASMLVGEDRAEALKAVQKHFQQLGSKLLPYLTWDTEMRYQKEAELLRDVYRKHFGDPDDPKVAGDLAKMEKMWKNRTLEAQATQKQRALETEATRSQTNRRLREQGKTWKQLIQEH